MNLFWLGVGGISLLVAHLVTFLFLRWRTQRSVPGILSVPRFELFLLILMLPSISQSAAFVIRGKDRSSSNFCDLIVSWRISALKIRIMCRWHDRGSTHWGFVASHPSRFHSIGIPLSCDCCLLWELCAVHRSQAHSRQGTMAYETAAFPHRETNDWKVAL